MGMKKIYPKEAIEWAGEGESYGAQAKLARVLGISRAMVGQFDRRKALAKKYVDILKEKAPKQFGNRVGR